MVALIGAILHTLNFKVKHIFYKNYKIVRSETFFEKILHF
uniref:Uncharacterized protein n=1 Tax=Siphoviridae sp. ctiJm4 TaxID=2827916 RepID=A0A8S5T0P7_9CAUD|nr:MAG TPA: hypothetical protein [Siphoviridae sp. ctiJm4]